MFEQVQGEVRSRVALHEINPLEDPRWRRFVENHPRSTVFHSFEWLEALRRTYGYEPIAVTTCPPHSELLNAAVFCRVESILTGRRLVSLPFSDHCDVLEGAPEDCISGLLGGHFEVIQSRVWL